MRDWLLAFMFRLFRVPCGHFGGAMNDGRSRWCDKEFGHSDSHTYEWGPQPLTPVRLRAQGYDA